MPLNLRWRDATTLVVDAEPIRPDQLRALTPSEVGHLPLMLGNAPCPLGELFEVTGSAAEDGSVVLEGHMKSLHGVATGMESGSLRIQGSVGARLGAWMSGGSLELVGDAAAWAGAEMSGGTIRIRGHVGPYLGAPLPGGRKGMREGVILVQGRVGDMAGLAMRRGLIAIKGSAGDALAQGMIAGSIFVFGSVGRPIGVGMKRGSIVVHDPLGAQPELHPTFHPAGSHNPTWLELYLRRLSAWGMEVPAGLTSNHWLRFNGDTLVDGQGEVLVSEPSSRLC